MLKNDEQVLSNDEKERYQRQILKIGEKNQYKLTTKTVLQVGAGGLGSPLALYLVSSGVGTLIIFETDTLSLSNLGRHPEIDQQGYPLHQQTGFQKFQLWLRSQKLNK